MKLKANETPVKDLEDDFRDSTGDDNNSKPKLKHIQTNNDTQLNSFDMDYSKLFIPFSKFIDPEDKLKELRNKYNNQLRKYNRQFKAILKLELFL
jgi:hypothetical protein